MFSSTHTEFQAFIDNQPGYSDQQKSILLHHESNMVSHCLSSTALASKWMLSNDDRAQLTDELKNSLYFVDHAISLFKDNAFSTVPDGADDNEKLRIDVENLLKFLLIGTRFNFSALAKKSIIDAIFTKQDPDVIKIMREEFQAIFDRMDLDELNNMDENQEKQFHIQLSNILALYTFSNPFEQAHVTIPQKTNGEWERVKFKIDVLELKPKKRLYPHIHGLYSDDSGNVYDEHYRVYAYGLTPEGEYDDVSPILLFMGTPPETGQGHKFATLTDFTPNHSVGESLYKSNRKRLHHWIKTATNDGENKLWVMGQSLGGALSLLLALDVPRWIKRVDAMNPPGLYESTLQDEVFSAWDKIIAHEKPEVIVQMQQYDPVKHVGFWKLDWNLIKIFPLHHELFLASYLSHIRSFANQPGSIAMYVDPAVENARFQRRLFTSAKQWLDPVFHFFISHHIHRNNQAIIKSGEREEVKAEGPTQ